MKRVGIIGLGTVGGGFYDISHERKEYKIVKVLNRSKEKYTLHGVRTSEIARNVEEVIQESDIVVETVGGLEFPYEVVTKALKSGRDVVTANKALIASYGEELIGLAKENGVKLLFGASVGGGMPALRFVKYHSVGKVKRVYGILNATSNFLLSKVTKGLSFEEALQLAQRQGYAESDPTDDIQGMDAARKMAIVCGIVWGMLPDAERVPKSSIYVESSYFEYAKKLRLSIKPLVFLSFEEGELKMWSGPVAVPESSRLADINGTENCLIVEEENGINFLSGKGAGKNPTAFAIMADVLDVVNDVNFTVEFHKRLGKINAPRFENFGGLKIFHPPV